MEAQMVEQAPGKYTPPSITVPGWPDLEAPSPCENEISRHPYVKKGKPVMIVTKLADGTEERFFLFENSIGVSWRDTRPPTFLHVLYNHDAIQQSRSEPIFFVESEPEADQLSALGLLATTYGRPAAIPPYQHDLLRGRTVLAVGRAGEDGEVHVNAVRDEYKSVATVRTLKVEDPSGVTQPGYRLEDWLRDTTGEDQRGWLLAAARGERVPVRLPLKASGKSLEALPGLGESAGRVMDKAVQQAPARSAEVLLFGVEARCQIGTPTVQKGSTPLYRPARPEIVLSNDPCVGMEPAWLVKDVLPETGAGMIYAPSMAGKSFVGIDLCYAVENGIEWAGRQVRQGRAIYVASELSASILRRSYAQFEAQDLDRPFAIIRADNLGHHLTGDSKGVESLIQDIDYARGQDDVRLVFVDTFETIALGTDENSSSAVGQVWDCLTKISARFNCFVLVAHHTGKDGDRYRGSSTLMNRSDTVVSIKVLSHDRRRLKVEKQRDGRSGLTAEFVLETIPGSSCCFPVFVNEWHLKEETSSSHSGHPERAPKAQKGEKIQSAILGVLHAAYLQTGETRISKKELLQHKTILSCMSGSSNDTARRSLDRVLKQMDDQDLIVRIGSDIKLSDTALSCPDMSGHLYRWCA
jgi:hypothetical protein